MKHTTTFTRNWQAKRLLAVLLAGFALTSCEEPQDIGLSSQKADNEIEVLYTDTVEVVAGTVILDSLLLAPGGTGAKLPAILTGTLRDPELGNLRSTAYLDVRLKNLNPVFPAGSTADSIVLKLEYNYGFGVLDDESQKVKLEVHRLSQAIDESKKYYSSDSLTYSAPVLATAEFAPSKLKTVGTVRVLSVQLDQALAAEILGWSGQSQLASQANFRQALNGLALVPAGGNAIVAFKFDTDVKSSYLELYYTTAGAAKSLQFPIDVNSNRHYHLTADRSGTALAGLASGQLTPAAATNGLTYLQGATGVRTKVQFPGLDRLRQRLGAPGDTARIAINRAELVLPVKAGTISTQFMNPTLLRMAEATPNNRVATDASGNDKVIPDNSTAFGYAQFGALNGKSYKDSTRYVANITSYVQQVVYGRRSNTGMLIYPAGVKVQASRAVLKAPDAATGAGMKLRLYFTRIKNQQ